MLVIFVVIVKWYNKRISQVKNKSMKRISINLLVTSLLFVGIIGFLFTGKALADNICFMSAGSPVACSTVKGLGADTSNIVGDNKCYGLKNSGGKSIWVEVDCANPANEIGSTGSAKLDPPKFVKNDCNGENLRANAPKDSNEHCGILDYLLIGINLLSALVGVVVIAMIIIGGIQYSAAGDDPQKVMAAKSKIANAILALVVFIFMYGFLQWVVPGGIF